MKILDPGNDTLDYQNMKKIIRHQADVYSPNSQEPNSIVFYSHPPDPENAFNSLRIFPTLNLCVSFSLTVSRSEVGRA